MSLAFILSNAALTPFSSFCLWTYVSFLLEPLSYSNIAASLPGHQPLELIHSQSHIRMPGRHAEKALELASSTASPPQPCSAIPYGTSLLAFPLNVSPLFLSHHLLCLLPESAIDALIRQAQSKCKSPTSEF